MKLESLWEKIALAFEENIGALNDVYPNFKPYTKALTDILVKLGEQYYGHVDTEYWPRVDISYFDHCTNSDWDEWAREVAIEIENSCTWDEELNKLFCINAGIKVLITYHDGPADEMLNFLNGEFKRIYDSRKYHQANDQYLIIFGPTSTVDLLERREFMAFSFDGKEAVQLKTYDIFRKLQLMQGEAER